MARGRTVHSLGFGSQFPASIARESQPKPESSRGKRFANSGLEPRISLQIPCRAGKFEQRAVIEGLLAAPPIMRTSRLKSFRQNPWHLVPRLREFSSGKSISLSTKRALWRSKTAATWASFSDPRICWHRLQLRVAHLFSLTGGKRAALSIREGCP